MAKYRALVSFAGKVSMSEGEVREINNPKIEKDLLDAHYIEEILPPLPPPAPKSEPKKRTKKNTPKGG